MGGANYGWSRIEGAPLNQIDGAAVGGTSCT